ncbi:MAG: hypothetical protein M3393_10825 [Actinomycetota bacterium]|nr:hypothetical protein [Actinomycetota bacterium]
MTVFVGGVGELFQGDLDLGRLAVERLLEEPRGLGRPGADVVVEELHYGAVAVTQRIQDLRPSALILLGAVRRGRPVGSVHRRWIDVPALTHNELQAAVGDAVTGYVGVDLVIEVASGFGMLPARTVTIELEPESVDPGEGLSESAAEGLEVVLELLRREVDRMPLLELADDLRARRTAERIKGSVADSAMSALLDGLVVLEHDAHWDHVFARRDDLRLAVAAGRTSEAMDQQDWALWWALIEEVDRLQAAEVR